MAVDLKQNFTNILKALEEKGKKPTYIAREMGYTTTAQLNSVLSGESQLSTKAVIGLIENIRVNPMYLFLGKGEMFMTGESELESLQKKYSELERKFYANIDDLLKSKAELERAINRYNNLIDITSIAMDKTKKPKEEERSDDNK